MIHVFKASLLSGYGSYVILIPIFSGYLIWSHRCRIFDDSRIPTKPISVIFLLVALAVSLSTQRLHLRSDFEADPWRILAAILLIQLGFLCCYGARTFRRALFPMLLLFAAIPIPTTVADMLIGFLQSSSAALCYLLFSALGIPVLREGVVLSIPGVTIEVAKECSGINSSVALLLTVLFIACENLASSWRRTALVLFVVPLSILKNVVRIVTLTLLAVFVDRGFLTGKLHQRGGVVFYIVSLAALYPVFVYLRRSEREKTEDSQSRRSVRKLSAAASKMN